MVAGRQDQIVSVVLMRTGVDESNGRGQCQDHTEADHFCRLISRSFEHGSNCAERTEFAEEMKLNFALNTSFCQLVTATNLVLLVCAFVHPIPGKSNRG